MKTARERISALATAARTVAHCLGEIEERHLVEWLEAELGHVDALDAFVPVGSHYSRAYAPENILHIVSGNTPHAALQSLLRGLLLGSRNFWKLPSEGLPEAEIFLKALSEELRMQVEVATELPEEWLSHAQAVVVYGSDETIAHFRKRVRGDQIFEAHGHRVSFGVVMEDPDYESVRLAARDVCLFDQMGCLSPHGIYVCESNGLSARRYAARLAEAMETVCAELPPPVRPPEAAAQILDLRAGYAFRSANDHRVQIWTSPGSDAWTVIYEEEPWFAVSCLHRVVFVKPLPERLADAVAPVSRWLGAIGIWPAEEKYLPVLEGLRPSRICPLGRMQEPPLTWHAEGRGLIENLVRWLDFEGQLV